jgi:2,4-dienoyl-CoA reductase-like NADH-dependent reductase (Old Yellow Enzyme family)
MTTDTTAKKALLQPVKVGRHLLQHRVVLAPLTRFRANAESVPQDVMAEYYKQRASAGGLMITEGTFITRLAGGYPNTPGIWSEEQIQAWRKITDAVHQEQEEGGGRATFFLQLWHIGRQNSSKLNPNQEQIVGPSAIKMEGLSLLTYMGLEHEVPHELTVDEIKDTINDYRQAALNAMRAGFDGVEIHCANGYLPDQFINSYSNQRTDEYGGSTANRCRFILELADALSEAIGEDRVALRFSPGGEFGGVKDEDPKKTFTYLMSQLQETHPNLAYIHCIETRADFFADDEVNTKNSLDPYRNAWKGPFISAGGFSTSLDHAEELVERTGDLIAFGRAFIANPDLPERIRNGWELNPYDRNTFYQGGAEGYTTYPFYEENNKQAE